MSEQQSSNLYGNLENLPKTQKILVTASQCDRALQILKSDRQHKFAAYYKIPTLKQSIVHRFWLTNSATVESYLQLLQDSIIERELLYDLLFTTKSQFFLNPKSWKSLAVNIIPQLMTQVSPEKELRCWVVGCGMGEEAYTLSILLDEAISATNPLQKVKIMATDANASALKIAMKGIYPNSIAEHISPKRLKKYFTLQQGNYVVKPELRQKIVFAPHNLLTDIKFAPIDLICCRNTLIYLQPQYRQQALSVLYKSLSSQGILFLGNNESLFGSNHMFFALQCSGKIFQKREIKKASWSKSELVKDNPVIRYTSSRASSKSSLHREVLKFCFDGYPAACLLLSRRYQIIHVYYNTSKLVKVPSTVDDRDVTQFIAPSLRPILLQALERVTRESRPISYRNLRINSEDRLYNCDLKIDTLRDCSLLQDGFIVVLLEKSSSIATAIGSRLENSNLRDAIAKVRDLELEIEGERANLQDAVAELDYQRLTIEEINRELIAVNKNTNTINQELYAINQTSKVQVEQLKELNQDIETLLGCIDIGVIFLDRQLNIRKYNSSAQKIINFRASDVGRPLKDLNHNLNCDNLVEIIEDFLQTQRPIKLEIENLRTKEFLLMKLHPYGSKSHSGEGVVLTFVDISDRKQTEQTLKYQAFYDSLTELPNRLLFKEQLQHAVTRLPRQACQFLAVLYLDLNGFKEVNDSLGHAAGDLLLVEVGRRLSAQMRSNDIVSRLGGDEFAILLEEIDRIVRSLYIASRIHQVLSVPFTIENHRVTISTSIGIACHSSEDGLEVNIETLMENADMAMYRAKQKGTAQTEIFLPQMRAKAEATIKLKNQIRQALHREEFLLYYQPIFGLKDGRLQGFEALLRWNHPELGLIPPKQFLATVQNSALFFQLECSIIDRACSQLLQWLEEFELSQHFSLSINVSPRLLAHVDFLNYFHEVLERMGTATHHLTIELTETALIENAKKVEKILERLKARGIKIALDDFGTGFSSLSHLHRFPLNIIKIDRSFVMSLNRNERSSHIVGSIIYMSQQLNLVTVAEGVEDFNRLKWLQQHNCQLGQGYFWNPALPAAAATELLRGSRK